MSFHVKLPDGSTKEFPEAVTPLMVAESISSGLAKQAVAARVNGEVFDIQGTLPDGAELSILKGDSDEGLDAIRHSAEHLMAAAVCEIFPDAQVTMGPKSHAGEFHYDFDLSRPLEPKDLDAVTARMKELIKAKTPFTHETMSKGEARKMFKNMGQTYKDEILDWIEGDDVTVYTCGNFKDLCRGPHVPHAGHVKAFKLLSNSGSYWRADANNAMLQRITGIAFHDKKALAEYLHRIEEAKKRDHRRLGKEMNIFSVSEKHDNHRYGNARDVEMLVTGSVSQAGMESGKLRADAVLDDKLLDGLANIFAPRVVKMNGYNVPAHSDPTRPSSDIQIRLFAGDISKEQAEAVRALEKETNERLEDGKTRIVVDRHFTEEVGPGLVLWHPKGGRLRTLIEDQWRKMHYAAGYDLVYSPHLAKSDLWKVSGHWDFYREGMFSPMAVDGQEYLAKPMNCPFHVLMYKDRPRSYRELPLRWAELGTVYRYEMAGTLHGLMRVRGFTQDDAHIFCTWEQVREEIDRTLGFVLKVLKTFGFETFTVNISTRPEKYVGSEDAWEKSEKYLEDAVQSRGLPYQIDEGGGAFYGPKIDVTLEDCLGRTWQCSTIQLDFNNPERFGLSFVNSSGEYEQPVMLHRALLGSIERFIGILIEHYAGVFPMWLAPEQVRVLPIADDQLDAARTLADALKAVGLRATVALQNEKLGAKIRQAQLDKVPAVIVVGKKEAEQGGGTVRYHGGTDGGYMSTEELIENFKNLAQIPEAS